MQHLLDVTGLEKRFGPALPAAVDGVSFAVEAGEVFALLGPSGCGKTTTLRLVAGFERPDAGTVRVEGRDVTELPPERRRIGFVFQDYALFPHLSALENVVFGLRRRGRRAAEARAREMLALVGLEPMAQRRPHELSGGQQQRVALARTLAVAPPLVLMDEPFSNLDAAMRVDTRQEVRKLLALAGSAVILVTHDQEEAMALADRVAVMQQGRLVQIGTPDEVYRNPASAFVAGFMGRANIVQGIARGHEAQSPLGPVVLSRPVDGAVRLSVRPEQILLEPDPSGRSQVVGREFRGHDQLYWVQQGEHRLLVISGPATAVDVGSRVRLRVCDCVAPLAEHVPSQGHA